MMMMMITITTTTTTTRMLKQYRWLHRLQVTVLEAVPPCRMEKIAAPSTLANDSCSSRRKAEEWKRCGGDEGRRGTVVAMVTAMGSSGSNGAVKCAPNELSQTVTTSLVVHHGLDQLCANVNNTR
ncbi:unnamed protein product [Cercopithifilaria johnstoni]|uniref:Uncharacterized protein n=1 Tax=Cercopithifilaria johnstoni TaxID=2874296 RepID=A0A8J2Q781_9BILA|nr:unnamed protein product [Cercopithifilaria johnstoni]